MPFSHSLSDLIGLYFSFFYLNYGHHTFHKTYHVYWITTNRYDLSAEEIATVYKLRWNIEIFFGWWKRHLKVYHLIARSKRGFMAQILGVLTQLLNRTTLSITC